MGDHWGKEKGFIGGGRGIEGKNSRGKGDGQKPGWGLVEVLWSKWFSLVGEKERFVSSSGSGSERTHGDEVFIKPEGYVTGRRGGIWGGKDGTMEGEIRLLWGYFGGGFGA
ncbi:hypothetical protein Tco_0885676 [Tanacetum coccineum]